MKPTYPGALAFVLGVLTAVTAHAWVLQTVDPAGITDLLGDKSIAVDSAGKVHISYHSYGDVLINKDQKYATNASGTWATETVGSCGYSSGCSSSIAVDSLDKVHISYASSDGIKYVSNASGAWATEIVGSAAGDVAEEAPSIAVDNSDKVHISYSSNDDIKYVSNASGAWATEIVDSTEDCDDYTCWPSIAVDSLGKVHISYSPGYIRTKYVSNTSGSWEAEIVDSTCGGLSVSLAVDSLDRVHIGCGAYGGVKHVSNASGSWEAEIVDSAGIEFGTVSTSIAIDGSDKVHVSYAPIFGSFGIPFGFLKYATNASGSWVTGIVDPIPFLTWTFPSIALDRTNRVHISYHDFWNDDLKYATNAFGPPGLCSATAEASAYEASPVYGPAGLGRLLACFLLPIGAVIALKFWRRGTIL